MKRVIFSLYIDIPKEELDIFDKNILKKDHVPTNYVTKDQFKKNYAKLVASKKYYADKLGIDFLMFEYDNNYVKYQNEIKEKYPFITTYNIVNFYKIHLLYELSKNYDEILYLDFDVVPLTDENFFDVWDLKKGIAIYNNNDKILKIEGVTSSSQTIRSPTSKFYNAQAMLFEKNLSVENDVINTGIIGIDKTHLNKLKYFDDFSYNLNMMTNLKSNYEVFPKKIVDFFGYDNETLFSVKIKENKVPVQWLDRKWHYFFDVDLFIPKETKLVHAINKRFDIVWRKYYA